MTRYAQDLYIGDRVERKGYGKGTVICKPKHSMMVGVEFDNIVDLGHKCDVMPLEWGEPGRNWHCLYLVPNFLQPVEEGQ